VLRYRLWLNRSGGALARREQSACRLTSWGRGSVAFGPVGLGAAALGGGAVGGRRVAVADGAGGGAVVVEEIGAAFVGDGGGVVLGGGASVRGDGVREPDGGGLLGGDDVVDGARLTRAEPAGAVVQGCATLAQLVGPVGEVVAGIVDALGHLLVATPRDHRTADVIAVTVRRAGGSG
jgi:hypothetical protein